MEQTPVDAWLLALDGDACGTDLEYDPEFLELEQAAAGKPETQFGPAEPPAWPAAVDLAERLFQRTRDLRIAVIWGRAQLSLEGLSALPSALRLLHGLLDNFWDEVHPRNDPDDGDAFARLSVLGTLDKLEGLLGDVRQALLLKDRRLGGLRVREVEIALDRLGARPDEMPRTAGQIQGLLAEHADLAEQIGQTIAASLEALKALQTLMNERFGIEQAIEVKTLRQMLEALRQVLPLAAEAGEEVAAADEAPAAMAPPRRHSGGLGEIESRQDAVRAIELVCAYLDRHEPTNPAQFLLRRAQRLIDKNFLQLVRDLAPEAVGEIARIMGVDPESLDDHSGSY